MRKTIILGLTGNLSRALAKQFPHALIIPKNQYMAWLKNPTYAYDFFLGSGSKQSEIDVFNCAGVTNSLRPSDEINLVNYDLPMFLSEISGKMNFRLITFGTVMEQLPNYAKSNPYLDSKFRFFEAYTSNKEWLRINLHIQMHTLYGGPNSNSHMFLGQIYDAVMNRTKFEMSSGVQIREYHHINDDAAAIKILTTEFKSGVKSVSHGDPKKLKDIATDVFEYYGCRHLLNISAHKTNENDNLDVVFERSAELFSVEFRPTISGITSWLDELGCVHA
jgi:hypothetical protein